MESEEVTESEPEEVSEENAVPAEETAPEEQNVSGADEAVMDASSGNQTEPVETTEVTGDTEEITDETANATEETETKLQMQLRSQRTAPMRPLASQ